MSKVQLIALTSPMIGNREIAEQCRDVLMPHFKSLSSLMG